MAEQGLEAEGCLMMSRSLLGKQALGSETVLLQDGSLCSAAHRGQGPELTGSVHGGVPG